MLTDCHLSLYGGSRPSFCYRSGIDSERVWFASACSGHGFKHSAAVGEALAQKALGEEPTVDLRPFARNRRSLHSAAFQFGLTIVLAHGNWREVLDFRTGMSSPGAQRSGGLQLMRSTL